MVKIDPIKLKVPSELTKALGEFRVTLDNLANAPADTYAGKVEKLGSLSRTILVKLAGNEEYYPDAVDEAFGLFTLAVEKIKGFDDWRASIDGRRDDLQHYMPGDRQEKALQAARNTLSLSL